VKGNNGNFEFSVRLLVKRPQSMLTVDYLKRRDASGLPFRGPFCVWQFEATVASRLNDLNQIPCYDFVLVSLIFLTKYIDHNRSWQPARLSQVMEVGGPSFSFA